jgi:hypothetical protein
MRLITILFISFISAAALVAQESDSRLRNGDGSQPVANGTADDPYAAELKKAQDAEREWKRLDMSLSDRLEGVGVCTSDPANLISTTATARVQSLNAFGDYYRKHQARWREALNYSVNTAADRAPDRSEVLAAISTLDREKADLERRQRDLAASLAGQDTPEARKTSAELAAMVARKGSQLERSTETLRLFDSAHDYLKQRREFARIRLREIAELVEDIQAEGTLWKHLYNGILHSWELRCDKATPRPTPFDGEYWRTRKRN